LERFKLLPKEKIKDSIVIDFGCNIGQSCIEISKMGAKEV
jgi:ribosomal protein L11 methylase PrmA